MAIANTTAPHFNSKDETGNVYGSLTVIEHVETGKHGAHWRCQCKCGAFVILDGRELRRGRTTTYCSKCRPPYKIDIAGQVYGRWTVIEHSGNNRWLCRCSCGKEKIVIANSLRMGSSRSCGCLKREHNSNETHGKRHTITYDTWRGMKDRCLNKNHDRFRLYGGRGITVCDRWIQSFEAFIEDMGERPSRKHSIERINNDGNYCPENCRWATQIEQTNNCRKNRFLEYDGKRMSVSQWARELGVTGHSIISRLDRGWSVEKTLTTPPLRPGPAGLPAK